MRLKEIFATLSVLVAFVGVPLFVGRYQQDHVLAEYIPKARVVTLTGVAKEGVWTTEQVDGHTYWRKTFAPATLYLEEGEDVVLRLQSADVHHRFYVPGLNVGPIEVEPGHTEVVRFQARSAGTYRYYCTSICGDPHFYMSGWIVVIPKGEPPTIPESVVHRPDLGEPPPQEDMIRWGRYLYQKMGCTTCHGLEGRGGIENFNYVRSTIPAHNTLAEKFFLEEKEDADAFVDLLLERADLDSLEEPSDIPRFQLVLAQYRAAKELIRKGKESAKLDPAGPEPPLQMPAWQGKLTDRDMDAIIASLITLYPWEEEE